MTHRISVLLPVLLALLAACGGKTKETSPLFDPNVPMSRRIEAALKEGYLQEIGCDKKAFAEVKAFYAGRGYKPLWTNDSLLNEKGGFFAGVLDNPGCIGIPENRWEKHIAKQKHLIAKELLITARLGSAIHDLKTGLLDTATKAMRPVAWTTPENFGSLVKQTDTVSDWGSWFASLGAPHRDYRRLAKKLYDYAYGRSFSKKTFALPSIKEDSAKCYALARASLTDKGFLAANAGDSVFIAALETFQGENGLKPDGVIGTYTKKALEESAQAKIDRAILSLERWRWRKSFSPRYIWINIPEYSLRVYYNDTLYSQHNVVVGKSDTKTPQLRSRIRSIVSFPYWTVPFSITSKEFLPALKANPSYLARNHLKIFRKKDEEIDPSTVNWKKIPAKTFPYRVRQEPGYHNSLGIIKFEFSNPFGVYVHDTPSKSLFRNDIRSYSHGCIRCQMPDSLARFILRRDAQRLVTTDTLDSLLARKEHRSISLRHPVDIEVDYITVVANDKGLTFFPDIYGRDAAYLEWIYKNKL
jgi:L,D-transpeptidase YcbB